MWRQNGSKTSLLVQKEWVTKFERLCSCSCGVSIFSTLHPQNDLTDLDPIFHQVPTRRVLCLPSAKKRNCFEIHEKPPTKPAIGKGWACRTGNRLWSRVWVGLFGELSGSTPRHRQCPVTTCHHLAPLLAATVASLDVPPAERREPRRKCGPLGRRFGGG